MTAEHPIVFVVDDDRSIRDSIRRLVDSVDLHVETFESARDFISSKRPDVPSCLVLDVRLPDLSGLDLQRKLGEANVRIPIIFITGHGDIPMSVRAMKAGAVEFLTKPFRGQDLLDAIQNAIARDRVTRQQVAEIEKLRTCYDFLTPREKEVLHHVVAGRPSKEIAAELGVSEATVKTHRAHIMEKMRAGSLADLVRITEKLHPLRKSE